jgi:amino acid adenylation domain-containing protein
MTGELSDDFERITRASTNWVELVQRRAERMGARAAYTFLLDGEERTDALSYAQLDQSARALAVTLASSAGSGERALLLLAPGTDFVRAFFGCLYAGLVAVPVPLPARKSGLSRLSSIVRDCRPSVVVASAELMAWLAEAQADASLRELLALRWVALESVESAAGAHYRRPAIDGESIAFLQYTSGSTGTPKGVVLTHRNLLENERSIARAFAHDEHSVVVGWLPPFHDMGLIGNVLQPIFVGATSVQMAPLHFLAKPVRWLAAIARHRATTSGGPNFAYDLCVQKIRREQREQLDLSSWRLAFNGAEPVRAETMERFARAFAGSGFRQAAFYPCYGLAEATLLVSGASAAGGELAVDRRELEAGRIAKAPDALADALRLVGSGRAHGALVRVVHPETKVVCRPSEVGEIWVSGSSVAQGYWAQAESTAQTFSAHTADGQGPFLRTGDLGACVAGELFVTGRLKDLIVVRGRNLYPQDLEQAAQESTREARLGGAAAFSVEAPAEEPGERVVVVQEIAGNRWEGAAIARAIRDAIAERFEVSVYAVVLIRAGALPRTTSGKVQRRATRDRFLVGSLTGLWSDVLGVSESAVGAPLRTPLEHELGRIWSAALARPLNSLGRDQDFVQLGGDSLQATQVAAYSSDATGVALRASDVFEHATIASLAAHVEAQRTQRAACTTPAGSTRAPLSRVQERLWFLEQLVGGAPVYHVAGALRLRGPLDEAALERAVNRLVARHQALRMRFVTEASGVVQEETTPVWLPLPVQTADQLARGIEQNVQRPFALSHENPARFALYRLSEREHLLLFVAHHLVMDGWSTTVLVRELATSYQALAAGQQPAHEAEAPRLTDVVLAAQATPPDQARVAADEAYWQARFAAPVPALALALDHARGALPSHAGARLAFELDAARVSALEELGRSLGATPFMTFTALFAALLARRTGQTDLCIGTPVIARPEPAHAQLVGCLLNTLALRFDLSGEPTFEQLVLRARSTVSEAQRHGELPFERVLELSRPSRELSRAPLFDVMISLQPAQPRRAAGDALTWSVEQLDTGTAQYDLALDLIPTDAGGGLRAAWEYNRERFERSTIEQLTQGLHGLLAAVLAAPRAPLSTHAQLSQAELVALRPRPANPAPVAVLQQLEQWAEQIPEAEALVCGERSLRYRELNAQANQLARALRAQGVHAESRVGICQARTPQLVVSVLAVHKAGAAYVPLDPEQPTERTGRVLAEAGLSHLLVDGPARAALRTLELDCMVIDAEAGEQGCFAATDLALPRHEGQLAYVLYTSGSTGRPKGVEVTRGGLAHTLAGWRAAYGRCAEQPRVLSLASAAFDVWTADWVRALCTGGALVLADRTLALEPQRLLQTLEQQQISLVDLVPAQAEALLRELPTSPATLAALRLLIVGSDAWSGGTARLLRERLPASTRLLSCYGVTEASIDSAWLEIAHDTELDERRSVPLGEPFAGTGLYVLDRAGQPVANGVVGELAIGGGGVARGYLRLPALTAAHFVPDVVSGVPGARMYLTGDRVRRTRHGLEFLGRDDRQIKLRGVRVELGELEACLLGFPKVSAAAVVLHGEPDGRRELVAYVVAEQGASIDLAQLRAFVRARLPEALCPQGVELLARLPLGANGKVDRRALGALPRSAPPAAVTPAPRSPLEQALVELWRELLSGREVSVHDNFFDLGGHSLLLAQVQTRLAKSLGRELPILLFLQHPTIASLAAAIEGRDRAEALVEVTPAQQAQRGQRRAALLQRRRGEREGER